MVSSLKSGEKVLQIFFNRLYSHDSMNMFTILIHFSFRVPVETSCYHIPGSLSLRCSGLFSTDPASRTEVQSWEVHLNRFVGNWTLICSLENNLVSCVAKLDGLVQYL